MTSRSIIGFLAFFMTLLNGCGNPNPKPQERASASSADAIEDSEDIVAERPAVISGSHLFCDEEEGVMGEDLVNVVCSIDGEIDYKQFLDRESLVIEVAGKVVPITIDSEGKFEFTVSRDQEFSTENIVVHDMEELVLEDGSYPTDIASNLDDTIEAESTDHLAANSSETMSEEMENEEILEESENPQEEELSEEPSIAIEENEVDEEEKGKGKSKSKDKKNGKED